MFTYHPNWELTVSGCCANRPPCADQTVSSRIRQAASASRLGVPGAFEAGASAAERVLDLGSSFFGVLRCGAPNG